jgi:type I restriction enzyme, S subunit
MTNNIETGKDFVEVCKQKRLRSITKMQPSFPLAEMKLPSLPSTWIWASLSELSERVSVGHVGPTTPFFTGPEGGVPFIRSQDVRPGRLVTQGIAHIKKDFHQKLKKSQLKAGDVLVVRVGANRGDVCIVPDGLGELNCANIVFARPMFPNKYIGYYLQSPFGQDILLSMTTGAAQGVINTQSIAAMPVPVPPLPIQRKIADVLSAYDDLIEVNTRRIGILEQMAQFVYREWFGKVDAQSLPEGWEIGKLGDIAKEIRRNVQPNQINSETPYFGLEHFPRKSIALSEWGKAGDVQSTKLAFKKGEILFGKIRPYFHKVGVAPLDGVSSTDAIVIMPKEPEYFGLTLSCVSSEDFVNHATQTSQGTKMPRANWDVLVNYQIPFPPKDILKKHNDFMQDIVDMIQNLLFANRNLRRTRDLLLPRLVSGEIELQLEQ